MAGAAALGRADIKLGQAVLECVADLFNKYISLLRAN